ncbi:MAG: hypothetical protein ABI597_06455 [Gammaproteobacteria bacterium]
MQDNRSDSSNTKNGLIGTLYGFLSVSNMRSWLSASVAAIQDGKTWLFEKFNSVLMSSGLTNTSAAQHIAIPQHPQKNKIHADAPFNEQSLPAWNNRVSNEDQPRFSMTDPWEMAGVPPQVREGAEVCSDAEIWVGRDGEGDLRSGLWGELANDVVWADDGEVKPWPESNWEDVINTGCEIEEFEVFQKKSNEQVAREILEKRIGWKTETAQMNKPDDEFYKKVKQYAEGRGYQLEALLQDDQTRKTFEGSTLLKPIVARIIADDIFSKRVSLMNGAAIQGKHNPQGFEQSVRNYCKNKEWSLEELLQCSYVRDKFEASSILKPMKNTVLTKDLFNNINLRKNLLWDSAKSSRSAFIQSIHNFSKEKGFDLSVLLLDSNNTEQLKEFNKDPLLKMVSASVIAQHIYEQRDRDALISQGRYRLKRLIDLVQHCSRKYHFELKDLLDIPEARKIFDSSKRLTLVRLMFEQQTKRSEQKTEHEHHRAHEKHNHHQKSRTRGLDSQAAQEGSGPGLLTQVGFWQLGVNIKDKNAVNRALNKMLLKGDHPDKGGADGDKVRGINRAKELNAAGRLPDYIQDKEELRGQRRGGPGGK